MASQSKKFLAGVFINMLLALSFLPAHASQLYTRGSKSPQSHQAPQRFTYTNPFYRPRSAPQQVECKPHGQARCLTPKKNKIQVYTRQNTAMKQTKVHPYLRKIYKPKVYRTH